MPAAQVRSSQGEWNNIEFSLIEVLDVPIINVFLICTVHSEEWKMSWAFTTAFTLSFVFLLLQVGTIHMTYCTVLPGGTNKVVTGVIWSLRVFVSLQGLSCSDKHLNKWMLKDVYLLDGIEDNEGLPFQYFLLDSDCPTVLLRWFFGAVLVLPLTGQIFSLPKQI